MLPAMFLRGSAAVVICLLLAWQSAAAADQGSGSTRHPCPGGQCLEVPLQSGDAEHPRDRHARAADDPGKFFDCAKNKDICDIYSRAFQSLPNMRTSGAATLRGVPREQCAARCALLAPACRHFSYNDQERLCILGCRAGSGACEQSGALIQDESWTFHFLSARKLASITNSIILALQSRAADSANIQNITASLEAGRFGKQDLTVGAEPAIEKLFGSAAPGSSVVGAASDMMVNGGTHLLPTDCGSVPLAFEAPAPVPSILGGEVAYAGQYPWQARILVSERGDYKHRCGGTIISDRHILSAAHCLRDIPVGRVLVRVGETDLDDLGLFHDSWQSFTLVNMRFHKGYLANATGGAFWNDIMMLQLRHRNGKFIQFGDVVQPACVPRAGLEYQGLQTTSEVPLSCKVSGWGKTSNEATETSKVLRGVEVPIVSDSYCGSPEAYGRRFLQAIMFCAGFTDEGVNRDSCGGDSGGPLACPLLDSGRFAVYGIVSHSHPKGCGREPGMYTKVSHFTAWILDTVKNLS